MQICTHDSAKKLKDIENQTFLNLITFVREIIDNRSTLSIEMTEKFTPYTFYRCRMLSTKCSVLLRK